MALTGAITLAGGAFNPKQYHAISAPRGAASPKQNLEAVSAPCAVATSSNEGIGARCGPPAVSFRRWSRCGTTLLHRCDEAPALQSGAATLCNRAEEVRSDPAGMKPDTTQSSQASAVVRYAVVACASQAQRRGLSGHCIFSGIS